MIENDRVEIGALIRMLRKKKRIKKTELFEGLCSKEVFERIENGKGFTDELLVERLLSRLHIQYRLLEVTLSDEEFERKELRAKIELYVEHRKAEAAEKLLEQYESLNIQRELEQQYILWMRAKLLERANPKMAGEMYRQAFYMTGKGVVLRLLSMEELDMYLGYCRCSKPLSEKEQKELLSWMEKELLQRQIYSYGYFAMRLAKAKEFFLEDDAEHALQICTQCIEILNSKNKSSLFTEFLFLKAKCNAKLYRKNKEECRVDFYMVYYTCLGCGEENMAENVAVYCKEEFGWHITDAVK